MSTTISLRRLTSSAVRSFHTAPPLQALPARKVPIASRSVSSTPPQFLSFDDLDSVAPAVPSRSPARPAPTPRSAAVSGTAGAGAEGSGLDSVIPSAPMSTFPNDQYRPLPSAVGIPGEEAAVDWTTSFAGLSATPFDREAREILLAPLKPADIECKPDGLIYLPEIKYRRTLNLAFGPGGWGLAPRGETQVTDRMVSREWGLVCLGRLVSVARGEQEYFDPSGIPTATEGCKSNALMRCSKDLGIASELWDPAFIRSFKAKHCVEVFAEHATSKKKKKLWRRIDQPKFDYPWKEGK